MCCEPSDREGCSGITYLCCGHMPRHRHFLSREEEIEMLEKYENVLENEIVGLKQKIQELKG